jgi:hypothetical protein
VAAVRDDRLAHLQDVGRLLWPAPLRLTVGTGTVPGGPAAVHREYLVLPNRHRPRLLVPHGRRAAAGAVRRYGVGRSRSARWQAAGLAAGMAAGLGPLLLRDRVRLVGPEGDAAGLASIETYLSEVLGHEVLLSMYLGAPRANRKPVLQLLTRDGRTVAWVKVGIDPLTCALVRAETTALVTLAAAGLRRTTVPAMLHSGSWNGLELLVQSALPVGDRRGRPTGDRVAAAQVELASVGGTAPTPLATSTYWTSLTDRVAALPERPATRRLAAVRAGIEERFGDVELALGAWHGDWTPWNTAQACDRLLVWDWERFGTGVPAGFDALHWALQSDLVNRLADPLASARACLTEAGRILTPWGLDGERAPATAAAYLVELGTRYLADRQDEAGARLGNVGAWLLPAVEAHLTS